MKTRFRLGQIVMTRAINDDIADNSKFAKEILNCLRRYINADFSDMEYQEDIDMNMRAIKTGDDRIFATYNTSKGKIYIITEWDRSVTTILYPEDY
jgi:hypothetical protein